MEDLEVLPDGTDILGEARTRARRSTPRQRVEIITHGARRNWRLEEKREIVLASLAPGAMPSAVCREHGIGSGQLSVWRQQFREGRLGHPSLPVLNFAAAVVQEPPALPLPDEPLPVSRPHAAPVPRQRRELRAPPRGGDVIEIALPNGMIVRVGTEVDQAALGRVLAALKGV